MKLSEKELKELKHLLQSINLNGYPNLLNFKKKISSNDKVELFIDGSADLQSKTAGIGGVIFVNQEKFKFFSEYLHDSTNNEAEYESLIFGIEMLIENKLFNANIFSDSQLVVNQVNGIYKIKNDRMKLLHQRATNLLSSLNDWTFDYIPREKNTIADKYADLGRRKSN